MKVTPPTIESHITFVHQSTKEHQHVHGLCDITGQANRRFVIVIPELCCQTNRTRDALRHASTSGATAATADQELTDPAQPHVECDVPEVQFPHKAETSQAQVDSAVVVVAREMDLDQPGEHTEKVALHRRLHPQPRQAFLHGSVKGSATPRLVAASCMWCYVRAGRAERPPKRSQIWKRTFLSCTYANMWRRKQILSQKDFPIFKNDGIFSLDCFGTVL